MAHARDHPTNPNVTIAHLLAALSTISSYATNVVPADLRKAVAMLALIKTIATDALANASGNPAGVIS